MSTTSDDYERTLSVSGCVSEPRVSSRTVQDVIMPRRSSQAAKRSRGNKEHVCCGDSRRRQTSRVWLFFDKTEPDSLGKNTVCKIEIPIPATATTSFQTRLCGKRYKVGRSGSSEKCSGTSGLWTHLKECHPKEYQEARNCSEHSSTTKDERARIARGELTILNTD